MKKTSSLDIAKSLTPLSTVQHNIDWQLGNGMTLSEAASLAKTAGADRLAAKLNDRRIRDDLANGVIGLAEAAAQAQDAGLEGLTKELGNEQAGLKCHVAPLSAEERARRQTLHLPEKQQRAA